MKRTLFFAWLTVLALLDLAPGALACPSCRDAVPSTSAAEEDDQVKEARAYNNSIYLLAGMPYLLLGIVGFGIYRGVRKPPVEKGVKKEHLSASRREDKAAGAFLERQPQDG